jgi:hypothetical protein
LGAKNKQRTIVFAFFVDFRSFRIIRVVLYFVRAVLQVALSPVGYQDTVFITDTFKESHNVTLESKVTDTSLSLSLSFSLSIGTAARCGLWPVEQYPSIFSYLSPILSIFSLLALADLFLLSLSIFSWAFPYVSSLPVLE